MEPHSSSLNSPRREADVPTAAPLRAGARKIRDSGPEAISGRQWHCGEARLARADSGLRPRLDCELAQSAETLFRTVFSLSPRRAAIWRLSRPWASNSTSASSARGEIRKRQGVSTGAIMLAKKSPDFVEAVSESRLALKHHVVPTVEGDETGARDQPCQAAGPLVGNARIATCVQNTRVGQRMAPASAVTSIWLKAAIARLHRHPPD